jgi:mycothiol synthase
MAITERAAQGEGDYARMRALLVATYATSGPPVYATVGDLDWWRYSDPDPAALARARLWLDAADGLVGIAWPSDDQVDLLVHPRHHRVLAAMLAWAEQRRREAGSGGPRPPRLTAWAYEGDGERQTLLGRRGYRRGEGFLCHRGRRLDAAPPAPRLPAGYALRHVCGEADLSRRAAVHRAAFAPSELTPERYRAVMGAPTYRPELDLVVEATDGSFAAFGLAWLDAANWIGTFEPVGCHPAHQRRGLATAIMGEGLRRLRAAGATMAFVTTGGEQVAANALYDAVGFGLLDRNWAWEKSV